MGGLGGWVGLWNGWVGGFLEWVDGWVYGMGTEIETSSLMYNFGGGPRGDPLFLAF
jgi:hypothetical protein